VQCVDNREQPLLLNTLESFYLIQSVSQSVNQSGCTTYFGAIEPESIYTTLQVTKGPLP